MFKTGDEAVRWIHSRKKFGSRPGFDTSQRATEAVRSSRKE